LVTGYRPGALGAFGLTTEELAARHPGLVVGRVSAWGHTGPWADRRGFDSIVQAASGIAVIEGLAAAEATVRGSAADAVGVGIRPESVGELRSADDTVAGRFRPGALPAQALDHAAGHLLAAGLTLALTARHRDGR